MPVVTLNAQFVSTATCPEGKKKENYYDSSITGFILEVRCTGGKTYALRYRDAHNKQIQHKIGDAASISFDKAKNAAKLIRSRVVLGENPAEEKKHKKNVPTVQKFFDERFLPYSKAYKRSWKSDVSIYRSHMQKRFASCHLDEITQQEVFDFHHGMLAKGYAKATCNRALVLLKLLYNLGRKWKIPGTEINPCTDVPNFQANNARERYLTVEETQRLHIELIKSDNPQLKYIIALLLLTGARKRELLEAKWRDVDLERRIWTVPLSKSGKPRYIPLSDAALEVLKQLPRWDGCPYVVPNPKDRQPFTCFYRSWNTARINAGLPDLRVHDIRHSTASNLVNNGVSILEVAKILGHAQIRTTERYSHLTQDTLLTAVNIAATATGVNWAQPASSTNP